MTAKPEVIVTHPGLSSFSAVAGGGGGGGDQGARGSVAPSGPGQQAPFLNRGRQEGKLQAGQSQQQRQDRSNSSGKRQRTDKEGGWQEQRPYRSSGRQQRTNMIKAQVMKGSSTEYAELGGHVTWWVGKCRPDVTEEKVKEVLEKLAVDKCGATNFTVESVPNLTKDPNPWSRSFKVCVPASMEKQMQDPRMYPLTWESRQFTQWPTRQQPAPRGGSARQVDDGVRPAGCRSEVWNPRGSHGGASSHCQPGAPGRVRSTRPN